MTGEWEYKLRQIEHGKFSRDGVHAGDRRRDPGDHRARQELRRGRLGWRGSPTFPRPPTASRCARPCAATSRRMASSWSTRSSPTAKSRRRRCASSSPRAWSARSMDSCPPRPATASPPRCGWSRTRRPASGRPSWISATRPTSTTLTPFWTDPRTGAELCEAGNNYVLRERDGGGLETDLPGRAHHVPEAHHAASMPSSSSSDGKTDLIQGFISRKGRPFDAFLKREDGRIAWEFPPRAPKLDKDGKPIARKAKAPPDLSKAVTVGRKPAARRRDSPDRRRLSRAQSRRQRPGGLHVETASLPEGGAGRGGPPAAGHRPDRTSSRASSPSVEPNSKPTWCWPRTRPGPSSNSRRAERIRRRRRLVGPGRSADGGNSAAAGASIHPDVQP